ncbi:hypothetical protein BDB00DRAFT_873543 [Zychaea mexicana]|uniref:uncharacterized protein n=1 Tax=Zychaea mexicana TaxID=64656 RepID=UPI0022FEEF76|nr:uncharacterized protein BDB00DRAFT_873543 [Zychaea mexicana]KAI9492275.1 hypothetical protein BDB00DRAFT_873543 [Zychaea mexicana]
MSFVARRLFRTNTAALQANEQMRSGPNYAAISAAIVGVGTLYYFIGMGAEKKTKKDNEIQPGLKEPEIVNAPGGGASQLKPISKQ